MNIYHTWYHSKGHFSAVSLKPLSSAQKRTARIKRAITQSIVNSSFLAITWQRGHYNLLNLADSCHVYGYMCLPSFIDVGIKIAGLEQVEVITQFS